MALITPTVTRLSSGVLYKWETVSENDTCKPVYPEPSMSDKTFQVTGTFGSGSVALRGTLDASQTTVSSFMALNDLTGEAIAPTTAGAFVVAENCIGYAPGTPGGTAVDVDCWLLCVA